MRFSSLFRYDRDVPAEWRQRLEAVMPAQGEGLSRFELGWESGEMPTEDRPNRRPVGRWCIYQVTHPANVPPWKREIVLEEPETPGHFRIRQRLVQTGELVEPWWIIQGTRGGHKVEFSDAESALLYLEGRPWEPPTPGSLPYAEFDNRVVEQIVLWDRLRSGYRTIKTAQKGEDADAWRQFRKRLLGFLNEQVSESVEDLKPTVTDNDIALNDRVSAPDWDRIDADYIDTGHIARI